MLIKSKSIKAGIVCAAVVGLVQAAPITPVYQSNPTQASLTQTLTPSATYSDNNTLWQQINGVQYTDAQGTDGVILAGENVTFTIDMGKKDEGTHNFDALKVWIDNSSGTNLVTKEYAWVFDPTHANETSSAYSYKSWTAGDEMFTFTTSFASAGDYNLIASVMCSRDLSGLTGIYPTDNPNQSEWDAWTENVHQVLPAAVAKAAGSNYQLQGETEKYKLTVGTQNVPEPGSLSLILLGLSSLAGAVAIRRKRK
jgi:hypothetical protein